MPGSDDLGYERPTEAGGNAQGVEVSNLASLSRDIAKLREKALVAMQNMPGPGQMAPKEATDYMARIVNLFGAPRADVEVALCLWGMAYGTGGTDDYSTKPPIVVGSKSVEATEVFGGIVPVGVSGKTRQFFSTVFEAQAPAILQAVPEMHNMLAPRAAKAGLGVGQSIQVVDFVKGVTPATVGGAHDRAQAKRTLIDLKRYGSRSPGGGFAPVVDHGPVPSGAGGAPGETLWG